MKKLLQLEEKLVQVEAWILVVMVTSMLVMASYNVFYRNILVPWQKDLATSGPPVSQTRAAPDPAKKAPEPKKEAKGDDGGFGGGFGGDDEGDDDGFGGGFGGDDSENKAEDDGGFGGGFGDDEDKPSEKKEEADDDGGFGGGFGDDEEPAKKEEDVDDGGFGGGFGDDDAEKPEEDEGFGGGFGGDDDEDGFGGGFGDESDAKDKKDQKKDAAPVKKAAAKPKKVAKPTPPPGGPPPKGSFAETMVHFIDAIKLDWIDVLLRQLVIMVGFLGATMATMRRKHINIDALSKLLPDHARRFSMLAVNLLSAAVCIVLAVAGTDLVKISLEYPKELVEWADEWSFQLMFPIGFSLLTLHFLVRVVEDVHRIKTRGPLPLQGEAAEAAEAAAAKKEGGEA